MTSYFNTTELNTALTNLSTKLTEKANTANLYPVLKKATSSSEDPTPGLIAMNENNSDCKYVAGYVYQVLIEFSYESAENSQHLVEYLTRRLQRPSPHGVIKTLKTINHLVLKGSRHFRISLRGQDEHIKNSVNYANTNSSYTGTEILENTRKLSQDILVELFRDDLISADAVDRDEQCPVTSGGAASGLGSYQTGGKYEGFGNSPIVKNSVTERVRDLLESVISMPDPKKQIMQLCLEDAVGNYQPLKISDVQSRPGTNTRHHRPGGGGGGWSSDSEEEEETVLDTFNNQTINTDTGESRVVGEMISDESINSVEMINRVRSVVSQIQKNDVQAGVFSIVKILKTETDEEKLFRALLLFEYVIHVGGLPVHKLKSLFSQVNERLEKSDSSRIADKAVKTSLILTMLSSSEYNDKQ